MTEALIADLAQIQNLRVISRTSVMPYRGSPKSLPVIARELGADVLVEGSVLRDGNRLRVIAQLIEAESDRHLWAQTYDREARDILALQADVVRRIAQQVDVVVRTPQPPRVASQ
jgi:TolB-like protein